MARVRHTLFLACTRPAMVPWLGIPIIPFAMIFMLCGTFFFATNFILGGWWRLFITALAAGGSFAACRFAVAYDQNIFGQVFLGIIMRGKTMDMIWYWRGSSLAPVPVKASRADIPYAP